jgi:hypothetical protein
VAKTVSTSNTTSCAKFENLCQHTSFGDIMQNISLDTSFHTAVFLKPWDLTVGWVGRGVAKKRKSIND